MALIIDSFIQLLTSSGCVENTSTGTIMLPLLVRSLEKLIKIIDQEMNRINANKIIMPSMAPIALFEKSGRWNDYKNDVYTVDDEMLLSPVSPTLSINLNHDFNCCSDPRRNGHKNGVQTKQSKVAAAFVSNHDQVSKGDASSKWVTSFQGISHER